MVGRDKEGFILNREELTAHGDSDLRRAAVDIIDSALTAANPRAAVDRLLHVDGDNLTIGTLELDLGRYERVFILGAGKASRGIAEELEGKLGDRIGARRVMDLAEGFTKKDLVFAGITGGSSALLALPVDGVTLEDKQRVNQLLLLSGADIFQINCVRKHLSQIKGGWLAKKILPATLINLTVSDVVGDQLDYITGPTVPDTSSFDDARSVMDEFDLWGSFPASASAYLRSGGDAQETPKDFGDLPLHTFVVVPGDAACVGAHERANELGFNSVILTSMLEGEASEAGSFLAAIAKEVVTFGRPLARPCAVVAGGENVVTIGSDQRGRGGPNQEFALSASLGIADLDKTVIVSIDTDGSDGPTDAAGGMVDGTTRAAALSKGLDPSLALRRHDVHGVLHGIGDAIVTGPTGTNVNDLKLLLLA
jgi:glycerate-2-kinase